MVTHPHIFAWSVSLEPTYRNLSLTVSLMLILLE